MKKLITLCLLGILAGSNGAFAQSTGQLSFDWEPNPVEVIGELGSSRSVLSGNVTRLGQNAPILAGMYNLDTAWTRVYYANTHSMVTLEARYDGPNRLSLTGLAADTATSSGFLIRLDSTTLQPSLSLVFRKGDFSRLKGSLPMAGNGSLAFGEWNQWPVQYILLLALDGAGDTLWTRSYTVDDGLDVQNVFHVGTDLLVVGDYGGAGIDVNSVFAMRLDSTGQPLWAYHYPSGRSEWVTGSQIDANHNLYLAVTSEDTGSLGATMRLMSIDASGNFRFGTDLDFDVYDESFSILHWPGAGLYLGGTRSDGTYGPGILARFDPSGQFMWAKSYLQGGYAEPQSISRSEADGLIVAFVDENTNFGVQWLSMDSSGSLITPCTGTVENPTVTTYSLAALPLTVQVSSGCDIDSIILTPLYEGYGREIFCTEVATTEPMEGEMEVVPNPFHHAAEIRVPEGVTRADLQLEAWDIQGRQVKLDCQASPAGMVVQRGMLPAGLYLYRLTNSQGVVGTGKLVVE